MITAVMAEGDDAEHRDRAEHVEEVAERRESGGVDHQKRDEQEEDDLHRVDLEAGRTDPRQG